MRQIPIAMTYFSQDPYGVLAVSITQSRYFPQSCNMSQEIPKSPIAQKTCSITQESVQKREKGSENVHTLWSFRSQHYSAKVLFTELRHVSEAQTL